jgi:plasmid stabilization system protein ParE
MRRPAVVVHAEARRELFEATAYYDERRDGYGPLFVDAMEREFHLLLEYPRLGRPLVLGARRRTLRGWPYSIIYQPILGGIYVIAIAHHRRKPGYWRKRVGKSLYPSRN